MNGPALAADGHRVAVAWYTYVEQRARIRLALSRDAGRTFATPIEIDEPRGRRSPIGRVDVVLDGDGAIISWLASEREAAVLLVARVTSAGQVGEPVTVARTSAARNGGFPRMVRLGDALALAWTDAGEPSRVELRALSVNDLPGPETKQPPAPAPELFAAGTAAPEYHAQLLDGSDVALASLRGEVVLLNLWATWCEPCRHELGELTKLHADYSSKGVRIVAVSVDRERTPKEIAAFVERRKLPYSIWHDRKDRASELFRVNTLPASVVIDRAGTIVWSQVGALTAQDAAVKKALDAALEG